MLQRFAVHSRQRYITRYGDGLAGQKLLVAHFPILELQAFAVLRVENGCLAALCILCGILPFCAVFIISDRTRGGIVSVIGRQGDIFIQLGVQIEDLVAVHPCIRLQLFCQLLPIVGIFQLAAVRHRDRPVGAILLGNGHGDLRGCPFCIQRNVVGGHSALKLKCIALTQFVCIPASELIVGRNIIRLARLIAYIRNGLLELAAYIVNECFAAIEIDVIAVAGIVEPCVIVTCAYSGAASLYQSKAGNGILIFFCNRIAPSGRSVRMVQLVFSAVRSPFTAFAVQDLNIVIGCFAAITRLGAIEFGAIQRHGVNVYLRGRTVRTCSPCRTAMYRRPFIRDICPIFGCDTKLCILFGAPFVVEPYIIHISFVIYIQNGRAIACDGFGFGHSRIQGKSLIGLLAGLGFCACRAGFGFGLCKRIPIIIGVFLPVDHGVLGVFSLPACLNGGFPGNSIDLFPILIPTGKVIACLGGHKLRKIQRIAFNAKLRGNVAAAGRIKGDPIAGFHHGKQRAGAFGKHNVCQRGAVALRFAPALHGLFASQSQANHFGCRGNILWAHGIAFGALHGVHHGFAVGTHKAHIAGCLELGIHMHSGAGNFCDFAAFHFGFPMEPAHENIAVFFGRSGNFQLFAFGNSLGPIFLNFTIHIELIGIHLEIGHDVGGLHCAAKQIGD